MTEVKSQYFSNLIDENSENPRRLWDTINNILHRTPAAALPESNNVKSLSISLSISQNIFLTKSERSGPIFHIR